VHPEGDRCWPLVCNTARSGRPPSGAQWCWGLRGFDLSFAAPHVQAFMAARKGANKRRGSPSSVLSLAGTPNDSVGSDTSAPSSSARGASDAASVPNYAEVCAILREPCQGFARCQCLWLMSMAVGASVHDGSPVSARPSIMRTSRGLLKLQQWQWQHCGLKL
jgi:hypothetical protein